MRTRRSQRTARNELVHRIVEGYNQSSSKLLQSRGYRGLTLTEQLRAFGAGTLRVWLASFYVVSIGHFLWYREAGTDAVPPATEQERSQPSSLAGLGTAILINALFMSLVYLARGLPWTMPLAPAAIVGVPVVLLGVRTLVMVLVAHARGLVVLDLPVSAPAWLEQVQGFALSLCFPIILVALLLPFFPLWSYLGRQVWNWSRVATAALTMRTGATPGSATNRGAQPEVASAAMNAERTTPSPPPIHNAPRSDITYR